MNKINDKIAIIGFGASGFGTYLGLKQKGFKNIYIYNLTHLKKVEINEWNNKNLIENYKYLKNKLGLLIQLIPKHISVKFKNISSGNTKYMIIKLVVVY